MSLDVKGLKSHKNDHYYRNIHQKSNNMSRNVTKHFSIKA